MTRTSGSISASILFLVSTANAQVGKGSEKRIVLFKCSRPAGCERKVEWPLFRTQMRLNFVPFASDRFSAQHSSMQRIGSGWLAGLADAAQ